jgi:hypothetical protein
MQADFETLATIAIATTMQIGAQIWLNATLKADVKNLNGWVKSVDARGEETAKLAAELKGRLESALS